MGLNSWKRDMFGAVRELEMVRVSWGSVLRLLFRIACMEDWICFFE
jgi:hypothetical protein